MRRKRHSGNHLAVNLFPFLAVLICTMGVLIVMLVMAVKSSQVRAAESRDERQQSLARQREQLLDELDLEQFRVREIEALRPDMKSRLGQQRARRSHVEDEIRRLRLETEQLRRQWDQAGADTSRSADSNDSQLKEIESLESQLLKRESELDEMRQQVAGRPVLYSIIPTDSPGGTARRPIYVECRPDGLYLQPLDIRIPLDAFTIPVVAGNPLDAALLATREHWNRFDAAGTAGDPYPLLVVRPGGATAYAVARRSMKSWDDEFGYELVEDSRQIDWGTPEPALSRSINQALRDAMARQQHLVAMRQVQWLGEDPSSASGIGGNSADQDRGMGTGGSGTGGGGHARYGEASQGTRQAGDSATGSGRNGLPGNPDSGQSGFATSTGSGTRSASSSTSGESVGGSLDPGDTNRESSPSGTSGESSSGTISELAGSPNGTGNFQSGSSQAGSTAATTGQQRAAGQGTSSEMSSSDAPVSMSHVNPLSETRGQDWALPTRTQGATAYRRPIRIDCTGNSFTIHNTDPDRMPVRISTDTSLDDSVDALIHQIWNQIEEWGMAEVGGYWKPVLRISADADGALRAAELARKLDGSGLEIERLR